MTIKQAAERLNKHKLTLLAAVLLGAVVALGGSFLKTLEYRTSSTFLVIQEQRFSDPYAQARSAEYLAGILARIVDTDSFRTSVFEAAPSVRNLLPVGETELRDAWGDSVEVRTVADSGILTVSAYHADPGAARAMVEAIASSLTSNAATYLGTSAPVTLLQIDGPVTSRFPVKPNLLANILAGALVGFGVAAGWLLARRRASPTVRSTVPLGAPQNVAFDQWLRSGASQS